MCTDASRMRLHHPSLIGMLCILIASCAPVTDPADTDEQAGTDASLTGITLSASSLSPAFSRDVTDYSAALAAGVSTVAVTATASDAGATLKVRGNGGEWKEFSSGSPSPALSMRVGANAIELRVTAADWTTQKTYTIEATRGFPGGYLDSAFLSTSGGTDGTVRAIAVQRDGKILIGGSFSTYNGVTRKHIARLNRDGSLDDGFHETGTGLNSSVYDIAVQDDGKILVCGELNAYNGTGRGYIARLNSDGSLDETGFLATGAGADSIVCSIALQDDGMALIGGYFTEYNGTARGHVARINTDGSLDETGFLATGTGAADAVQEIAVQDDGMILIGGDFTAYNGTPRGHVARLSSDGSLDETGFLATGAGADGSLYSIVPLGSGSILIGGSFTTYNGTARGNVARLSSDGSLDESGFLASGAGADGMVTSIALAGDGRILVGGYFLAYNGVSRGLVARLGPDGALDATFLATGSGANDSMWSVAVQGDGKVLIGGGFYTYNGTSVRGIARLWGN
jgi:uncharacterized delta-60 repeat protein